MSETMPFYIWSHRLTITFPHPLPLLFVVSLVGGFVTLTFPQLLFLLYFPASTCKSSKHLAVASMGSSISSLLNKVNAAVGVNLLNLIWIGIAADGLDRSAAVIILGIIRASVRFAVPRGYIDYIPRHVRFMPRGFISLL
ncbi:hypothetical protein LB504_000886 [Fusarium proliferatum]|nr:hypothetical protein LB504_000886 [Fusarium proliferatum]